jgi:hypothetical protein
LIDWPLLVPSPTGRSQEEEKKIHHGRRGREVEEGDGDAATTAHMFAIGKFNRTFRDD